MLETIHDGSPGQAAFDQFKAEKESGWLHQIFIPPPGFDEWITNRPIILTGKAGAGKSAVRIQMEAIGKANRLLVVNWSPPQPIDAEVTGKSIRVFMRQVFGCCSLALVELLQREPAQYEAAGKTLQGLVQSFLHAYLPVPPFFLQDNDQEKSLWFRDLTSQEQPSYEFSSETSARLVITMLNRVLTAFHLNGVWVMVDGLGGWLGAQTEEWRQMLSVIFSTLAIFEEENFVFKVFLPAEMADIAEQSGVVQRRRAFVYSIHWDDEQEDGPRRLALLIRIVEKRLSYGLGKGVFTISDLVSQPQMLVRYLTNTCDRLPRVWLEAVEPIFFQYLKLADKVPIELPAQYRTKLEMPKLHYQTGTESAGFYIGRTLVKEITTGDLPILCYLYEYRGQTCERQKLYYHGLLGLSHIPRSGDPNYEKPNDWRGRLDTIIWRIRGNLKDAFNEAVRDESAVGEHLDPPHYIVMVRNRGYKLEHFE